MQGVLSPPSLQEGGRGISAAGWGWPGAAWQLLNQRSRWLGDCSSDARVLCCYPEHVCERRLGLLGDGLGDRKDVGEGVCGRVFWLQVAVVAQAGDGLDSRDARSLLDRTAVLDPLQYSDSRWATPVTPSRSPALPSSCREGPGDHSTWPFGSLVSAWPVPSCVFTEPCGQGLCTSPPLYPSWASVPRSPCLVFCFQGP